jgi:hypothetical protein
VSYVLSYTLKCDECGTTIGIAEKLPEHAAAWGHLADWFIDWDYALCKKCNEEIE